MADSGDTAGRLGAGSHHELRIHGVAGTPPDAMLDDLTLTSPAPDDCGAPPAGRPSVWRRRAELPGLRAYSWSSVTSGSARTALYLLLVPHLLVNVAGWTAVPTAPTGAAGMDPARPVRGRRVRVVALGVRLLALTLTVIMAQWALLICLDLVAYQWAVRIRGWPSAWLGLGMLAAALVVELVLLVTRLRLREPLSVGSSLSVGTSRAPLTDPVGYAWLARDQELMWSSPTTIELQRRAHHGAALGSAALVGIAMVGGWVAMPEPWGSLGTGLAVAAIGLGVVALAQHSLSTGREGDAGWPWLAGAARICGRVAALVAAATAAAVQLPAAMPAVSPSMAEGLDAADLTRLTAEGPPVFLPVVRDLGLAITIGYTAACLLVGLLAWGLRDRSAGPVAVRRAFNLPGLALLAGATGGGMGAAAAAVVSRRLGTVEDAVLPGPLPEALAITFAALAVALGWVVVVGLAVATRGVTGPARVVVTTAVHRLLRRGSWVSVTLTALAVAGVGMITLLVRSPDNPLHLLEGAEPLPQVIVLVAASLLAGAVGLGASLLTRRTTVGVAVAVLLLALATLVTLRVPADELTRQLRPAALAIGLLFPAALVAGKGVSALRNSSDRRTVAILWDVGTFLPRWFDPLCPPSYGDRVVTDLRGVIEDTLGDPAGPQRTLLLSAHSQGSVIAAAAVLGLPPTTATERLALLTYGSPLRHLHAEFFPSQLDTGAFVQLHQRLGGRWRNLARTSDPIGAAIGLDGVDTVLGTDPCGRGHSAYPRETAYDTAVTALMADMDTEIVVVDRPPARGPSTSG